MMLIYFMMDSKTRTQGQLLQLTDDQLDVSLWK